jgi:hypothetical protein
VTSLPRVERRPVVRSNSRSLRPEIGKDPRSWCRLHARLSGRTRKRGTCSTLRRAPNRRIGNGSRGSRNPRRPDLTLLRLLHDAQVRSWAFQPEGDCSPTLSNTGASRPWGFRIRRPWRSSSHRALCPKAALGQNLPLIVFPCFAPTKNLGKRAITSQADIVVVKTAIANAGRRHAADRFIRITDHHGVPRAINRAWCLFLIEGCKSCDTARQHDRSCTAARPKNSELLLPGVGSRL